MKPSEITNVKYRGGFKGPYIDVQLLIEKKVKLDVMDFSLKPSNLPDCESFCYMQIRIGGRLAVTWQSSGVLTQYLQDCKHAEEVDRVAIFPIDECIISQGDDKAYMLIDADNGSLLCGEDAFYDLVDETKKGKRRRR